LFIFSVYIQRLLVRTLTLWFVIFSALVNAQESQTNESIAEESNKKDIHQVNFKTNDDFLLSGQYFAGKTDQSAVLLLHDCQHDSRSYDKLNILLNEYGLHVLALDFRGFGASSNDLYSHQAIKLNSKDILTYQSEISLLTSFWQQDVLTAYQFLREKINKSSNISVVSSGCSAIQAVYLAEKMRIKSFVLITPKLDYMEKEHYKNLIDIPAYFISSVHHADSYQTTKELFDWNGDKQSTFQTFKGIKQNHSLLNGKHYVASNIAAWLYQTVKK